MTFAMEPADEPCPDCGSTHHRTCVRGNKLQFWEDLVIKQIKEEYSERERARTLIHKLSIKQIRKFLAEFQVPDK